MVLAAGGQTDAGLQSDKAGSMDGMSPCHPSISHFVILSGDMISDEVQ
jgi:hypothetical protein